MGKNDNVMKLFFANKENFASIIKLFYGRDVFSGGIEEFSERLLLVAENFEGLSKNAKKNKKLTMEHGRDVVKKITMDEQPMIIGLENQHILDSSEPVRVMLYDALEYERQRRVIQWCHRQKGDLCGDEYVAGFSREDKLIPVETIVIYYGREVWEFPKKLSDIWDDKGKMLEEPHDYPINLIDVRRLTDEQIEGIESDVRLLFGCIKYDEDPVKMDEFVDKHKSEFMSLPKATFQIIAIMTETTVLQEKMDTWKEKGGYSMCKAFEEWKKEAERIGLENGMRKGLQQGMQQGMQQGLQQGLQQGICFAIQMCKNFGVVRGEAMQALKEQFSLSDEDGEKYMEMYW